MAEPPHQGHGRGHQAHDGDRQGGPVGRQQDPVEATEVEGAAWAWQRGSTGPPTRVTTSTRPTGVAAITLAGQRQRGEGSDPVGVSSRTKPIRVRAVNAVAGWYSTA